MTVDQLRSAWKWRPIPGCPGRFVWEQSPTMRTPQDLAGPGAATTEFHVAAAADPVLVTKLVDGGLISYRKSDGRYLHTLNTAEGFARKLHQLRISL